MSTPEVTQGGARAVVLRSWRLSSAAASACPDDGPVVDADVAGERNADRVSAFDARPPQPGDSRLEIVNGFLEAMMAWPISTSVAKQYLTDDAAEEWSPDEKIVYTELGRRRARTAARSASGCGTPRCSTSPAAGAVRSRPIGARCGSS